MHMLFGALCFTIMLMVSGVMVVAWAIGKFCALASRGVRALFSAEAPRPTLLRVERPGLMCRRRGCGAFNPAQAQFCRRCGLPMSLQVVQRPAEVSPEIKALPRHPIAI